MRALVGFSGSLRKASLNACLLRAATTRMPAGARLTILNTSTFPLYNQDVEDNEGIPESVAVAKDELAAADGVLIATPEYNLGIPGVSKNVIDWLSRPPQDQARVLAGKPVALMGASAGAAGTASAQTAWLPVLKALRMKVYTTGGSLFVGRANSAFDASGELIDDDVSSRLSHFLEAFVDSL